MTYQAWHNTEVGKKVPTIIFQLRARVKGLRGQKYLKVTTSRLTEVKRAMLRHIQPEIEKSKRCVLMMLSNLAFPQWATVNCSEKRLIDMVCMLKEPNKNQFTSANSALSCDQTEILHQKRCFQFYHHDYNKKPFSQKRHSLVFFDTDTHKKLDFLFLAIHVTFPPILLWIKEDISSVKEISFHKRYEVMEYKILQKSVKDAKGFFVRQTSAKIRKHKKIPSNLFFCQNGHIISSLFVCDGIVHCGNKDFSDENFCACSSANMTSQCKFLSANSEKWICSPLYFAGRNSACYSYITQKHHSVIGEFGLFLSNCSRLHHSLLNDLVVDCGELIDEQDLTHHLINETTLSCSNPEEIPCRMGHSRCFNATDICVFRLDIFNNLTPCRTGEHIESCQNFECNNKFKCPGYYCLPWAYVCDGKWDCPFGQDESMTHRCAQTRHCVNMFKCTSSQLCIHTKDICNNFYDCPWKEDEQMCDLQETFCPMHCFCHNYAVFCNTMGSSLHWNLKSPFLSVHCISMNLTSLIFLKYLPKLAFLKLPGNKIENVCGKFARSTELLQIFLSFNLVTSLEDLCFCHTYFLKILNINHNQITRVHWRAFLNLKDLKLLSLSHNKIQTLSELVIQSPLLYVLSLKSNPLFSLPSKIFSSSNLSLLISDDHSLCCIAPGSALCFATKLWDQHCSDLLPRISLKAATGTSAGLILFLNLLSIGLQQHFQKHGGKALQQNFQKHGGKAFQVIVLSVNLCDLLCSLNLWIIFVADQIFRHQFVIYARQWQRNILCLVSLTVCLQFSLTSPFILLYLATARLMVVLDPIDTKFKRKGFTTRSIFCFILVSLMISCSFGFYLKFSFSMLPSGLCQPFLDPTHSVWIIQFVTLMICIVQITAILSILFVCIKLVVHLQNVKQHMKPAVSKSHSHAGIYTQLTIVVLSCLLSWVPANVRHISSLLSLRYTTELAIWLTIILTALNSVINPVLFITAALRAQKS